MTLCRWLKERAWHYRQVLGKKLVPDLFDTLAEMTSRRDSEAVQERRRSLESFLEFARTRYYREVFKTEIQDELAQLDRDDVNEPGAAIRLQGERRALRRILDRLQEREAVVASELRNPEA